LSLYIGAKKINPIVFETIGLYNVNLDLVPVIRIPIIKLLKIPT